MILKILILAALVKLLISTDKPLLCSGMYTVFLAVFSLISGVPVLGVLIGAFIVFGATLLFFWVLNKFDPGSGVWWLVAVLGVFGIGIVL